VGDEHARVAVVQLEDPDLRRAARHADLADLREDGVPLGLPCMVLILMFDALVVRRGDGDLAVGPTCEVKSSAAGSIVRTPRPRSPR
jgi:hypothetical protein